MLRFTNGIPCSAGPSPRLVICGLMSPRAACSSQSASLIKHKELQTMEDHPFLQAVARVLVVIKGADAEVAAALSALDKGENAQVREILQALRDELWAAGDLIHRSGLLKAND